MDELVAQENEAKLLLMVTMRFVENYYNNTIIKTLQHSST